MNNYMNCSYCGLEIRQTEKYWRVTEFTEDINVRDNYYWNYCSVRHLVAGEAGKEGSW
jgi:hypothetical protein